MSAISEDKRDRRKIAILQNDFENVFQNFEKLKENCIIKRKEITDNDFLSLVYLTQALKYEELSANRTHEQWFCSITG